MNPRLIRFKGSPTYTPKPLCERLSGQKFGQNEGPDRSDHEDLARTDRPPEAWRENSSRAPVNTGARFETIPQLDDWSRSRRLHLLFLERIGTTYFRPWQL